MKGLKGRLRLVVLAGVRFALVRSFGAVTASCLMNSAAPLCSILWVRWRGGQKR